MFADADLLGVPIRIFISPRNLQNNKIEITTRDKIVNTVVEVPDALDYIIKLREQLYSELDKYDYYRENVIIMNMYLFKIFEREI